MSNDRWDKYVYENGVLKNKFGIMDNDLLEEVEKKVLLNKLTNLYMMRLKGDFDSNRLKRIHFILFEDIYDFAGQFRDVDIAKEYDHFTNYDKIDWYLRELFESMNDRLGKYMSDFEIPYFLAEYYYNLIIIHPFREGNGRTIREFMRELVWEKFDGYELDYSLMDKDSFFEGTIKRSRGYYSVLEAEFKRALIRIDNKNEINDMKK